MVNAKVLIFPDRSRPASDVEGSSDVGEVVRPSVEPGSGCSGGLLSSHPRVDARGWMGAEVFRTDVEEVSVCPLCPGCGVETSWVQELVEEGGRLRYEDTDVPWECLDCHEGDVSDDG